MLIIYAHPHKTGHCGEILSQIQSQLTEQGTDVELLDLYDMEYDPVMYLNEHYTSGGSDITEENRVIQEKFKQHDRFIFIYPTWWNNMPAILKGFVDKIFTNHFAFEYRNKVPVGLLKGKAAVITTTGAARPFGRVLMKDRSVTTLKTDALKFCGIKSKGFIVGSANEFNEKQKMKIRKTVSSALTYLK